MDKFTELLIETEGGGNPEFRKMVWIQIEEEDPKNWQIGELRPTSEFISGFVQQRELQRQNRESRGLSIARGRVMSLTNIFIVATVIHAN